MTQFAAGPQVTVLDVGHGNAAVVRTTGRTAVVDAGPGTHLVEHLLDQGITHVDVVLISHADRDHAQGLVQLLAQPEISVGLVVANGDASKGRLWSDIAWQLDLGHRSDAATFEPHLTEDDRFALTDDVVLEVLAPRRALVMTGVGAHDREGHRITSNSMSAVVLVTVNGAGRLLLPADLDQVGLAALLDGAPPEALRADALVFPHHGGHSRSGAPAEEDTAFATTLLEAVRPRTVIFSTGRGQFETPQPSIVAAVRQRGGEVRIACTQLSERCSAVLPVGTPHHVLDIRARGRGANSCCAGTMRVSLSPGSAVEPGAGHRSFVEHQVPLALCAADGSTRPEIDGPAGLNGGGGARAAL